MKIDVPTSHKALRGERNRIIKIDVKQVAQLANLKINLQDEKKFEKQLNDVLAYFDKLNEVDTKGVEITSQVTGLENVIREDKAAPSLSQEEALSGTKSKHNGLFSVNAILDN